MSDLIFPRIDAIIPITPNIEGAARQLYKDQFLDAQKAARFIEATQQLHLVRIDDPKTPMVRPNAEDIDTLYMLWGHPQPQRTLDPRFMVGFACPLTTINDGTQRGYKPQMVLKPANLDILIAGGMGCCGSALQMHWSQILPNRQKIDEGRIPAAGLAHPEHANWLKGRVHPLQPEELGVLDHLAKDILHHRFPDDPKFKHDCSHHVGYAKFATKHTPG